MNNIYHWKFKFSERILNDRSNLQYHFKIKSSEVKDIVQASPSSDIKAVRTSAMQLQYNCNTRIFSCIAVVLHLCGPLQYTAAIQVFYNLQKTCRLLAAVGKNLYCSCIALERTAAIQ